MALLADPLNNNWRSVHLHGHDRGASISFRMEWKRHPVALLRDIAFVQYLPWIYARDFVVALRRRMGCSPSGPSCAKGGTRLMATKLAFTKGQMHNLNAYFRGLAEEPQNDSTSATAIEAIVERLVQRLMLAAGNLDRRFSSVFLVSLNEPRRMKRLKFEYLLRIDALSTPTASSELEVEEDAAAGLPGFIRLKILDAGAKPWREYADAAGRLRRDLVKAKLANLLAAAVKRDGVEPTDANVCGSPGQVVDAEVLDKILKQPDHCRIFYGPAVSDGSSPEPREHRVALIEDSGGILLRIALDGCKSREVEVRLLIGIGLSSWPSSADYPRRVPLYHCDALLHYTVAQSGMYAVAVGPYPGARCEDRATLWGIRVPAAEKIMSQHYAADSVPGLTESVLIEILHQMREGLPLNPTKSKAAASRKGDRLPQDRLRVVSRHILRTMHRWSLERAGPDPLTCWAPDTLSRHVLLVLDELVTALKCQNLRCYFLPRCNVMLQCARGGIVHREDSYASDCRLLESYLETLHNRSLSATPCVPRPLDAMETELIARWRDIVFSLPRGTADADYGYSPRQLEYLGLILEQALRARDCTAQDYSDICSYLNFPECAFHTSEQVENLVFLLKLVLIQAKDQIRAMTNRRARERERPRDSKKGRHCNTTSQFDRSVGLLIDEVRADRETASAELESRPVMTRMLLQWLYFGMDYDAKYLEPVLRPYLSTLFYSLHENCWYAASWRSKQENYSSEMRSLSVFCESVLSQETTPALGIVESLSKGWRWAESMTKMIEHSGNSLKLILLDGDKELRYNLTFAENKGPSAFSTWSKARSVNTIARRKRTSFQAGEILDSLSESRVACCESNGHAELRDASPLTYVASMSRQRARHRGPGDLVLAMLSLGKFRILQEVAALLPREKQLAVLDLVHRAARESSRSRKTASCSLDAPGSTRQVYRPRAEADLVDSSLRLSPGIRERRIILEHQKQLEREMQEMHDTLRRNALTRHRASAWDSNSVSSWSSSIDSFAGTITLRRYRAPIWDALKGSSPARAGGGHPAPLDRGIVARNKSEEMISREESPTWNTLNTRRLQNDPKNGDELPSWDALEATLNRRLCNYGNAFAESSRMDEQRIGPQRE
ncbi:uncharacterized protein LOC143355596 isoform X2 [Halictus rubicundus]|uniref:uncharacterized protein LOC143355596 isoform X2 n=1 Tax=Halictus rubicundus TaxID=77578 RepID=UPI0040358D4D